MQGIVAPTAYRIQQIQSDMRTRWRSLIDNALDMWWVDHSVADRIFTRLSDAPVAAPAGELPRGEIKLKFTSVGGGLLNLAVTVPGFTASVYVDDITGVLGSGQADVRVSESVVAGTYDLWTGQVILYAPQPPVITVDTHTGGILAYIAPGVLDSYVDDVVNNMQLNAENAINQLLQEKIAQYSTTVFGIEQFLPTNLTYGSVDVDQTIHDFVTDIPAADLLEVYFARYNHLYEVEAGGDLYVKIGTFATVNLHYEIPLPSCYAPPGEPPPVNCTQS